MNWSRAKIPNNKNTLQSLLTVEYKGLTICTNIVHHYIIQCTTSKNSTTYTKSLKGCTRDVHKHTQVFMWNGLTRKLKLFDKFQQISLTSNHMKIHSAVLKLIPGHIWADHVTFTGAPVGCNVLVTYWGAPQCYTFLVECEVAVPNPKTVAAELSVSTYD